MNAGRPEQLPDSSQATIRASRLPKPLLFASVLLALLLSWAGVLDKASEDYVDGALAKATIAFGTARAINGAISVAQSTTVSVGIGAGVEVSPGEILDPINDLVEDYSSAMKLAIASLVIQKILLSVVSETVFNVLLTVSGVALVASVLLQGAASVNFLFRLFVSLVFLRFILAAVVLLNGAVNHAFIDDRRDATMTRLDILPGEIEQQVGSGLATPAEAAGTALAGLEKEVNVARSTSAQAKARLEAAKSRVGLAGRLNPFNDDADYKAAVEADRQAGEKLDALLVRRCELMQRALDVNADAACQELSLAARTRISAASAGQAISGVAKAAVAALDIKGLRQRVEQAVEDMITAMALFILQTMLLPLLFLFALSRATKLVWGVDLVGAMERGVSRRRSESPAT